MLSAFRDLVQKGDQPDDHITMDGIYGVRTLDSVRLDRAIGLEEALAELRKVVSERATEEDV